MKNLNKIYRVWLSDFELQIYKMCKEREIKPSDFIREAIKEKAVQDLGLKVVITFWYKNIPKKPRKIFQRLF